MANLYNDSMVNELETYFIGRNDIINRWGNIVSSWSMLPGLVGFWPMSSVQRSTGNAYDMSGQGRTLTYTGEITSTYNIYNNFVPYIDLDGATNYLSRADETDLDVLGTEATNAAAVRGLTLGGWFWFDAFTNYEGVMTKDDTVSFLGSAYGIQVFLAGNLAFRVFGGGVNNNIVTGIAPGIWYFCVGRFVPSTAIGLYINGVWNILNVGIVASLNNSAVSFNIGNRADSIYFMNGRASLCFLSHQAYSNALINAMFQQSRVLFGV